MQKLFESWREYSHEEEWKEDARKSVDSETLNLIKDYIEPLPIKAIYLYGSSALSPDEQEEQDRDKHGRSLATYGFQDQQIDYDNYGQLYITVYTNLIKGQDLVDKAEGIPSVVGSGRPLDMPVDMPEEKKLYWMKDEDHEDPQEYEFHWEQEKDDETTI